MNLREFLVEAKINTYASKGESEETKLADGSKLLEFKKGEFRYVDKYIGSESFSGEELVYQNNELIWNMKYEGGLVSNTLPSSQVYEFLKQALQKVTTEKPFRGPDNFKENDLEYVNEVKGTVEKFKGEESISYKEEIRMS